MKPGTRLALDSAEGLWLPSRLLENVLLPLLEHISDAYLSYCKVYVTKQSGILPTIIPFMPRCGISGLGRVRCGPLRPWHKDAQRRSLPKREGGPAAGRSGASVPPDGFSLGPSLGSPWKLALLTQLSSSGGAKKSTR